MFWICSMYCSTFIYTEVTTFPECHVNGMYERGWGGQAVDSDWSVRSPHPFWNGIRTS
jgi:hypothetical protein